MRFLLALVAGLLCACLQAGERQRFRVVNNCPQTFTVVTAAAPCSFCTDCSCAAGACPGKCPVMPAAAAVPVYAPPVPSCAGGVCPAPSYQPVRGGLFRRW